MERAVHVGLVPVAMAGAGELEDFDGFVRAHWARVYRFAWASLRDRDAAETVAQDCFWRAYRSREAFRGEARVETWLMRIAVNAVRDHARSGRWKFWKRAGPMEWAPEAGGSDAEARAVLSEQVRAIWESAAQLPERQRTVFFLRFVEEMELLEIASAAGLTEGAVKNHLFRALRRVRREVGERFQR